MAFQSVLQPAGGIVRDGRKLVVPRVGAGDAGAELPPVCVKCGLPSAKPLKRNFFWHEPWLYVLALFALLIYAIVALVVRKKMVLNVPLCDNHRLRRRNLILTAWLAALAGIALPFIFNAAGLDAAAGVILMILMILAGAIIGSQVSNPIRPARIDDRCGVFTGCAEVFLQQFPSAMAPAFAAMPAASISSAPSSGVSRSSVPPPPPPPIK